MKRFSSLDYIHTLNHIINNTVNTTRLSAKLSLTSIVQQNFFDPEETTAVIKALDKQGIEPVYHVINLQKQYINN